MHRFVAFWSGSVSALTGNLAAVYVSYRPVFSAFCPTLCSSAFVPPEILADPAGCKSMRISIREFFYFISKQLSHDAKSAGSGHLLWNCSETFSIEIIPFSVVILLWTCRQITNSRNDFDLSYYGYSKRLRDDRNDSTSHKQVKKISIRMK